MASKEIRAARVSRHRRVRSKINGIAERPRLAVFRSLNHIYAQLIDDSKGHTLVAASTTETELKAKLDQKKTARAETVGSLMAERIKGLGIKQIVFDRGGYKYHGRVKALAEAVRKGGVDF